MKIMRKLKFKEIKWKYRKIHQRARFNNYKLLKNIELCYPAGNLFLFGTAKRKNNGKALITSYAKITKRLNKKQGIIWTPLYPDRLDFKKTKGVRMGGGRGKHYFSRMKFCVGNIIAGGWIPAIWRLRYARRMHNTWKRFGYPVKVWREIT